MFPRPPSIIPYGGFSPVRLEAPLSTGHPSASRRLASVQHPHHRPACVQAFLSSVARGHRLTAVCRRGASGTHRPLARSGLSSPNLLSLLRPDAPVSGTPTGFVVYARPVFALRPSRSLSLLCLVPLSPHATTLTPPVEPVSFGDSSTGSGSLRPSGRNSASGVLPSLLASDGFVHEAVVFSYRLRPVEWLGLLTSPRPRLTTRTGQPVYSGACSSRVSPNRSPP